MPCPCTETALTPDHGKTQKTFRVIVRCGYAGFAVQNNVRDMNIRFRQLKNLMRVKRLHVFEMGTATRTTRWEQRNCFRRLKQLLTKSGTFSDGRFLGFFSSRLRKGLSLEGGLSELPECLFRRFSSSSTRANKRTTSSITSGGVLSSTSLLKGNEASSFSFMREP